MPENPEVETLTATDSITTNNLTATGKITTKNITVTQGLFIDDIFVLSQNAENVNKNIAVTYSDGSEDTLAAEVRSRVCNINAEQHVLTCRLTLSSLSKAIKEMIIPIQFNFTGRQSKTTGATVAEINGTDLLMVHIYVENNILMAKVVFSETPSYTSIKIKINMVFYSSFNSIN